MTDPQTPEQPAPLATPERADTQPQGAPEARASCALTPGELAALVALRLIPPNWRRPWPALDTPDHRATPET